MGHRDRRRRLAAVVLGPPARIGAMLAHGGIETAAHPAPEEGMDGEQQQIGRQGRGGGDRSGHSRMPMQRHGACAGNQAHGHHHNRL
jgi:hypothetical protein